MFLEEKRNKKKKEDKVWCSAHPAKCPECGELMSISMVCDSPDSIHNQERCQMYMKGEMMVTCNPCHIALPVDRLKEAFTKED